MPTWSCRSPETDGTPVTILESLACGIPVVASDVPSVREWLDEFSPELLVPIADQDATTAAIRHVLDLPEADAAALRSAGRALVIERGDHATHMLASKPPTGRSPGARRAQDRDGRPAQAAR